MIRRPPSATRTDTLFPYTTLFRSLAVFYSDYTDIQLTANSCPQYGAGPCALPINGGSADVWGVELEGNFEPVDGLLIDASAGWLDFSYRNINPVAAGVDLGDVTPFTPRSEERRVGKEWVST